MVAGRRCFLIHGGVAHLQRGGPSWAAMPSTVEKEKQRAANAAAELVEDGMTVGLGTGTTVAYLLPALAARQLSLRCVATSPRTEQAATKLGLRVERFTLERLDIAIDGADQISPDGWLVKGGGGAHTREKLVAVTADRFVVIADSTQAGSGSAPTDPVGVGRLRPRVDAGTNRDRPAARHSHPVPTVA